MIKYLLIQIMAYHKVEKKYRISFFYIFENAFIPAIIWELMGTIPALEFPGFQP